MDMCPECRVVLSLFEKKCPLCGSDSVETDTDNLLPTPEFSNKRVREAVAADKTVLQSAIAQLSPSEKRRMTVEMLSVTLGIILIVTFGLDFLFSRSVTWSRYTGISLVFLWLAASIPFIFWNKPLIVAAILSPALIGTIYLWSVFIGTSSWFMALGLPISLAIILAIIIPWFIISVQQRKGLNAIGVMLASAVFLCIGIDASVSRFVGGSISLSWSIVIFISAIPVAGLFFYLHYRVTNQATLRKLFRL